MNRLIIIGNGFDLAHGRRTSYKNFIKWYISKCVLKGFTNRGYEDLLVKVTIGLWTYRNSDELNGWVEDYLSNFSKYYPRRNITFGWDTEDSTFLDRFKLDFSSDLMSELLYCYNDQARWVDIESEYYDQLKLVLTEKNIEDRVSKLVTLNTTFRYLIEQLEIYLSELDEPVIVKGYKDIFESMILGKDLIPGRNRIDELPGQTQILNFNYTSTAEMYVENFSVRLGSPRPTINYIHGKINDSDNPMIFGFGDEVDPAYKKMEDDSKVRGYFDYTKSFWYMQTPNYRQLKTFLGLSEYQVYVLGHSCGLSDRTMLRMIFQSLNCKSIKLFYHEHEDGKDNFTELTHDIARHFTDKVMMRDLIVFKDPTGRMPQLKKK